MSKQDEQQKIINEIVNAIIVEGPRPDYHRSLLKRHRSQWPTLWAALDKLIALNATTYSRNLLGDD